MMSEENIEPDIYLNYVHDIDVSDLDYDKELDGMLSALPGRKHIFTNGTVSHAENILSAYGVRSHFDQIFDIVAANYIPKPEKHAFDCFLDQTGIDPKGAVMIEDMAANLRPAAALVMLTVWLASDIKWANRGSDEKFVHYKAEDLKAFLRSIVQQIFNPLIDALLVRVIIKRGSTCPLKPEIIEWLLRNLKPKSMPHGMHVTL